MKKGRHRRFEEARALKRSTEPRVEPCPECGAMPGDEHASWCLHDEIDDDGADDDEVDEADTAGPDGDGDGEGGGAAPV
ncbi:MAG: hypothetical protein M3Y04_02545 [Actinomycetota bacterium]|nr:hypothetical protein [Actinomycetota bacterium]